jgi:hypothetical protein
MFPSRDTIFVIWLVEKLVGFLRGMPKRLRIFKLRMIDHMGFKLTSSERSEIAFWITRNVTESTSETLRKVRSGEE